MKDKTKETLDRLKYIVFNEIIDYGEELSLSECKLLLDYITNLQNENMKYDQCLTELTDNYKELQKELTNLQEENQRLQQELEQINEEHRKINGELREENEKLKNGVSLEKASDKTMILTQKLVIEQLKTKIDKTNWWLEEMLKQAKSEETKAIINGTLDLLLKGE